MLSGAASGNTAGSSSSTVHTEESLLALALDHARQELELISYITSHDLQAPLRAILNASEKLTASQAVHADPAAAEAAATVATEGARMKRLIHGVLDYMRLETHGPTRSMIDTAQVYATALSLLQEKITVTGARINCGPVPEVYGHRGRLTRLFTLVLDNALAYHSAVTEIQVSARRDGVMWEFCIADNGPGIDEEYHDIVFRLFQRLHTGAEHPGDGIGLALARKIVESHGGRMWLESESGKGSKFFFTLPASGEDNAQKRFI